VFERVKFRECGGELVLGHTFNRHPEEPRACAASRRIAACAFVAILRGSP
jgi:hypothetical protein